MNTIRNDIVCYDEYFKGQHKKITELINHIKHLKIIINDLKYENATLRNENNNLNYLKYDLPLKFKFKQYYYQTQNFDYEEDGTVKGCFFY